MSYIKKQGKKPSISSSKSGHSFLIADKTIEFFLNACSLPNSEGNISFSENQIIQVPDIAKSRIKNVIAFDGSCREIEVRKDYPSSKIAFFQFGALFFYMSDLEQIETSAFISPEDMSKLKNIQRLKLVIPLQNVALKDQADLTSSVRKAIFDFFCADMEGVKLAEALKWLIFEEYNSPINSWQLSSCPHCEGRNVEIERSKISDDFTFFCNHCNEKLYLTDVLRLHEAIVEELGAGQVVSYLDSAIEQLIIVFIIKSLLSYRATALSETLIIKNGPLAFFGQTANLHRPMRKLCTWLQEKHDLLFAGLEKSGAFVEHAAVISNSLENDQVLFLSNDYIYKYITPGKGDPTKPYGSTTYYGNKIIYKSSYGGMFVISMPTKKNILNPQENDFHNFREVLSNIQKLRCDMYDNSLMPVALASKLVSLSDHPSSKILQKFAISQINS